MTRYRLLILAGSVLPILAFARSSGAPNAGLRHSAIEHSAMLQRDGAAIPTALKALPSVPAAVDGATHPELVPDTVAYRHFLKATARSTTAAERERRDMFLSRAGLTQADRLAYTVALGDLGARLDEVTQQLKRGGAMLSPAALQKLKGLEDQALSDAQTRIQVALSPDGVAQLDAHINEYVKPRITIYRWSMK